jgi:hypothetical protein
LNGGKAISDTKLFESIADQTAAKEIHDKTIEANNEIPSDMSSSYGFCSLFDITIQGVGEILDALKLSEFKSAFVSHQVSGYFKL